MNYFGRNPNGVFASANLSAHLVRGALAALFLLAAIKVQEAAPLASLALGIAALVALRGCPVCWTMGLVETLIPKLTPTRRARNPRR